MKKVNYLLVIIGIIMITGCNNQPKEVADTIYINGKVYTVDNENEWAEAFAVKDGKFITVGTTKEVETLKGENTNVVDLKGQFVMPGLIEGHAHPIRGQLMESVDISMSTVPVPTFEQFKQTLLDYANANPDKEWLYGGVFSWDTFKDLKLNSALIDGIIKDRPVLIEDETGHIIIANSKALEMAGITKDTKDPAGGYFGHEKDGSLNGLVYETGLQEIYKHIPNYTPKDVYEAGKKIFPRFNSLGFTGIRIAQGDELWLDALKKLDTDGFLKMQVDCAPYVNEFYRGYSNEFLFDNMEKYNTAHLSFTSVKIIADGVPFGQTMWVKETYPDSHNHGVPTLSPEELERQIIKYTSKGVRVFVHCTGDAATAKVLESLEKSSVINGVEKIRNLRNQIAHNVIVDPNDYERMIDLNVIMEFSPSFWYPQPIIKQALPELGDNFINKLWPVRQTIDAGIHVALGSDWNQTWADPFLNTETLVTRRAPGAPEDSKVQNEAGRITIKQALYAYTMGGAYALMMENEIGSISNGKDASFVILSQNMFEVPENTIHKTYVKQTWFEGELVYEGDEKISF